MPILLCMIFMHIVDDYYLQGILASMKQKAWWEKQEKYSEKYKYDYIVALAMHSFSWTFCIMLPILMFNKFDVNGTFYLAFFANSVIHGMTDNLKANKFAINLVEDQMIHLAQIIETFFIFM